MFKGICDMCGEPIYYELTDVGIGCLIPHGWCRNKDCSTFGWATNNITRNKAEENGEYDEETLDNDDNFE